MTLPIRTRSLLLGVVGALAAVALVAVPTARAQPPFQPPPQQPLVPGGGTDLLRALLDKEGVEPVRQNDLWNLQPDEDLIVVVIGNIDNDFVPSLQWVRRTIAKGGAALVATDNIGRVYEHDRNPGIDNPAGFFNGSTVAADWTNREHTHNQRSDCPYAVPVSPDELADAPARPGRVWGVFRGLNRIATNQPTYFVTTRAREEYRYPLARFPKSARINGGWPVEPPVLAVGGDGPERWGIPAYSFLAVADSSIFINQMLLEPGTDNFQFAVNVVDYLQGPDKSRKRCLFYENGRVVERFDGLRDALVKPKPKLPPDAMPNIGPLFGKHQDKLVAFLDAKADEIQERDVIHRTAVGSPGSDRERMAFGFWIERALVIAAIAIVFFLLRRLWGSRTPQDVPLPPHTGAGIASTGPPGVFDRRQKEMVRRNNVYEPVRHLVREFFASVGAPPDPGPRMPQLEITRAVRKPESLRQALRDMWRLAYGPPTPLTAQRWFELEPYFDRLKQAHADGKWYFVT